METEKLFVNKKIIDPLFVNTKKFQRTSAEKSEWLGRAVGVVGAVVILAAGLSAPLAMASERIIRIAVNIFGAPFSNKDPESCSLANAWVHLKNAAFEATIVTVMFAIGVPIKSLQFAVLSLIDPKNVTI